MGFIFLGRITTIMNKPTPSNISYIAGFIDGEGSISILRHGEKHFGLQVQINQMDERPLEYIQSFYGGKINRMLVPKTSFSTKAHVYRLQYSGKLAYPILEDMKSKLVLKGEQARLALKFLDLMDNRKGARYTVEEKAIMALYRRKMNKLNGSYKDDVN